jgi:hypothetical protein
MDASQKDGEILACYLKADDQAYSQEIGAEKTGESQAEIQSIPTQEHSELTNIRTI